MNPFIEHPATCRHALSGDQWLFHFTNNYGASVIPHLDDGGIARWSVGVLAADSKLCRSTPIPSITDYADIEGVRELLHRIAQLPEASSVDA
jgi:hypothetical protein